jgi:hypothetical protein
VGVPIGERFELAPTTTLQDVAFVVLIDKGVPGMGIGVNDANE